MGNYFAENFGWRHIFFAEIPFGILVLVLALTFLPMDNPLHRRRTAMDWPGLVLLTAGLASLQLILEKGSESRIGWRRRPSRDRGRHLPRVALAVFVWWEWRTALTSRSCISVRGPRAFQALAAGRFYSLCSGHRHLPGVFVAALIFGRSQVPRGGLSSSSLNFSCSGLGALAPAPEKPSPRPYE